MKILGATLYRDGSTIGHRPINRTVTNINRFRKVYARYVSWKLKEVDVDFAFTILEAPEKVPKNKRFETLHNSELFNKNEDE